MFFFSRYAIYKNARKFANFYEISDVHLEFYFNLNTPNIHQQTHLVGVRNICLRFSASGTISSQKQQTQTTSVCFSLQSDYS